MPTYKNLSSNDLMLPGVGFVYAGKTFVYDGLVENPNLEVVTDTPVAEPIAVQPVQVQTTEASN